MLVSENKHVQFLDAIKSSSFLTIWRHLMRTGMSKRALRLSYNCLVDFKCVKRI